MGKVLQTGNISPLPTVLPTVSLQMAKKSILPLLKIGNFLQKRISGTVHFCLKACGLKLEIRNLKLGREKRPNF